MVTRLGGLSMGSRGYKWLVLYLISVYYNESNLILGFSLQIRRARNALGLWGPHGAGKAVWIGSWGSSICAGFAKYAGRRAAKWLFWNSEMTNVKI